MCCNVNIVLIGLKEVHTNTYDIKTDIIMLQFPAITWWYFLTAKRSVTLQGEDKAMQRYRSLNMNGDVVAKVIIYTFRYKHFCSVLFSKVNLVINVPTFWISSFNKNMLCFFVAIGLTFPEGRIVTHWWWKMLI